MKPVQILTFDGGGVRGAAPIELLARLDQARAGWRDNVSLMAGTSTGAFIALGLASGITPSDLSEAYRQMSEIVFHDTAWDDVTDLGCAIGADYDLEGLRASLDEVFGRMTMGDLDCQVLIPTFDLTAGRPKFFHNIPGTDTDALARVADVALRSSAAPVFFPAAAGFIDGGVVANNPSMAAVAQTQDARNAPPPPGLRDLRLLSFGTGRPRHREVVPAGDWGWLQWARPLLRIVMDGSETVVDYQCRQLLGGGYLRVNPVLNELPDIDEPAGIDALVLQARALDLGPVVSWLDGAWLDGAWLDDAWLAGQIPR